MDKSLSLIVSEVAQLEAMLIESDGEITPEIESMLAVREIQLPEKVDRYASVIERFDLIEEFYKEKADQIYKLAKAAGTVSIRCKENLKASMMDLNVSELTGNEIKFKLSPSNPSVEIVDQSKLNGSYLITETITKVDKKRIGEDLKLGVPVDGAELRQTFSLRKSLNRKLK